MSGQTASGTQSEWGVEPEAIRLSAGGYMLDFRYRVVNTQKAAPLFEQQIQPYLIDEETNIKLAVPAPEKVGSLRQRPLHGKPSSNRTYAIIFANPGQYLKAGSKVTVVIGEYRASHLVVE